MLHFFRQPTTSRQQREETAQRIAWGHWFALFNIVLALLIASRYAFEADWPNTLFGKLYFFISLFGHFSFIVFAVYLLVLFPLSFIVRHNRAFRAISVVLASAGLTVLLVDTEVFKRFYLHLSPLVWDLLINPDEGELSRHWQLLFVPMPLILLAEMLYSRWCWEKSRSFARQKWGKFVGVFLLCCFMLTHFIYAWADFAAYRPITAQKANYPVSYPMTARTFLEKHGLINKEAHQDAEETGRLDTFYLHYPKKPLQISNAPLPINLIIINVAELNNAHLNAEMMPNLWQISQQSQRFLQHYTAGNQHAANVVGLFYGLSGKYLDAILSEKTTSPLVSLLQQNGYQFGLFSHNGFHEPLYHRALFATFSLPNTQGNSQVLAQWGKWLAQRNAKQPLFGYVELALPPANDMTQRTKLLDWQLGELWQSLANQHLLRNSLIVITANRAEDKPQANSFSRAQTNVPMLIYWQGKANRYTGLSSHLDILPTLLKTFFGAQNAPSDFSQGVDLTQPQQRLWLLAADYKWHVAIMPNGAQYQLDHKGHFDYYNAQGEHEKSERPPLPLFLHLLQQSNLFIQK